MCKLPKKGSKHYSPTRLKSCKLAREEAEADESRSLSMTITSRGHSSHMMMSSSWHWELVAFWSNRCWYIKGNEAEIIYPNLYKGLGLKPKDLMKYDTPLVGFDGKVVIPKRKILLPVMTERKEVMVNFIVVNAFSLYTTILGQP